MRKKEKSLIKTIYLFFLLTLISIGIIAAIFITIKEIANYKTNIKTFKNYVIQEKKKLLRTEVDDVINYIEIQKKQRITDVKQKIKERTYEGYEIAKALYERYRGTRTDDEIKTLIIEVLRPIRFFGGRGYYFIDGLDGISYLFPTYPHFEGKSLLSIKDTKTDKSIVGEFIKIAKTKGEGYSEYFWYSPEDKTKRYKKIAYIKLFKPFNWIIGTGEYYLGDEKDLKKKILLYIKEKRYTGNGYFFVMDTKGTMLMHPFRPQYVGKSVLSVKDKTGKYITKEFLEVAKKPEGGFVKYTWKKPDTGKYVEKIAYAKLYPEWGWVIGTGVYLDDIDKFIEKESAILKHRIKRELSYIFLSLILTFFIGFLLIKGLINKLKENITTLIEFFKEASDLRKYVDIDKIHFEEFKSLAKYANKMIKDIEKNEKRASAILSVIPDLIFIIDKELRFIEYKARKEELYTKPEQFLGKKISEVFPEELSKIFTAAILRTFDSKELNIVNYKLPLEKGYGFYEARIIKISDKHVLILVRDITKETELQRRLDTTLRSIGDAVISTNKDGKVVFMNPVAEDLTGWNEKEAKGKDLDKVFHIVSEITGERIKGPVEKAIEEKKIIALGNNTLLISKDGTKRVIEDSASPIVTKEGELLGVVLVFRDVTEKRKLEKELAKMEKFEAIGRLAGGIAHDFNNLLTGILGYIEILKLKIQEEDVKEKIDKLIDALLRAKDLAYRLLTFSKKRNPIKEIVDVVSIVKDVTTLTLSGSNISIRYEIGKEIWKIKADKSQIAQVIQNIVLNAKEAMAEGGEIKIRIKNTELGEGTLSAPKGRYVKIEIKDTGPGIPKEIMDKIFDPFFSTKEAGNGLGLAVSYSIVEQHGGHITVSSEEGKGTKFTIYIPAIEKEDAKKEETTEEEREVVNNGKRILVMDDDENIREILKEELEFLGYEVEGAREGEEAIKEYSKALRGGRPFDLVILDLTVIGGIGGKDAAKKIKEIDPNAIIIISSGYSEGDIMANYKEYGFNGVLKKPYTIGELRKILNEILENI